MYKYLNCSIPTIQNVKKVVEKVIENLPKEENKVDNEKIIDKENEYMNYIIQHVQNVRKAAEEVIEKLSLDKDIADQLRGRVINHDQSKYSDEEFDAYRKSYYPISDAEKNAAEDELEIAWQHHYNCNDHHWQFWYNKETGETIPMTDIAIYELLADWVAMGYKFGTKAYDYYYNELKKDPKAFILHPETKDKLESYLEYFR